MIDKDNLRIVFMGTPDFAVPTLQRLCDNGFHVVAVVTQPDKPVGRHGSVKQPSAVKRYALERNIPVLQPEKMKDPAFLETLGSYRPDLQVVVAYRMLPEAVWGLPRFGTFNVHAALLPQYRGAAPINWAIINGEIRTGVTTFFLDAQIDTGRIILQKPFDIPDDADVEYVYDGLKELGADLALETIGLLSAHDGSVETIDQATRTIGELHDAPKLFKENCRIDWNRSAKQIYDFVRGLSPVPGAWTTMTDEKQTTLKVYRTAKTGQPAHEQPGTMVIDKNRLMVAANDDLLEIVELQPAGKKRMKARDFLNGNHDAALYRLV